MGRSLLIFSDVTFKMVAWWPYWIFLVSGLTLLWLWISTPNGIWVRAYWFSVTSFYKWLPGGHIRFFGFWMAWFRQRNSSLLWNFSFKFHVHVLCGCRQKPNDCQLCRFVMAALWFWTMFNCNPPISHCHPLLWSGGILVDHWSTISSSFKKIFLKLLSAKFPLKQYVPIIRLLVPDDSLDLYNGLWRVLIIWGLLHMLCHFIPPFFQVSGKFV